MDKTTLSHYGWVVIIVLVLAVMLVLATPLGRYVGIGATDIAQGFIEVNDDAVEEENIENIEGEWDEFLGNGETTTNSTGTPLNKDSFRNEFKNFDGTIEFVTRKAPKDATQSTLNPDLYYKKDDGTKIITIYGKEAGGVKAPIDCQGLFADFAAKKIDLKGLDTKDTTNMKDMFKNIKVENLDISTLCTNKLDNLDNMFANMKVNGKIDVSHLDVSNVKSVANMFSGTEAEEVYGFENWNTTNITSMDFMFNNCKIKNINVTGLNTSTVNSMKNMFSGYYEKITGLSSFNTKNVKHMDNMFEHKDSNKNFASLDLRSFDMSGVETLNNMLNTKIKTVICKSKEDSIKLKHSVGCKAEVFSIA